MSSGTSATMSEDEGDNTEIASSDGSDLDGESGRKDGQVDITKTSDCFLTLKDEPSDFLIKRPPAFEDEDDYNGEGEGEGDELEGENERPTVAKTQQNSKSVRFNDDANLLAPIASPSGNAAYERSTEMMSAFRSVSTTSTSEQMSKVANARPKSKAGSIVMNTQPAAGEKLKAPQTQLGVSQLRTDKQLASSQQQQKLNSSNTTARETADSGSTSVLEGSLKKRTKKKRKNLWICLENCKYDVVHRMTKKYGFKQCDEEDDWNLYWTDFSVGLDRVMEMKRYQKINHFPGMSELCRKDLLARNLNKMLKLFPKEYTFFPRTWVLPADYGDLQAYSRTKKNQTYIIKPPASCQGRGIWLTKNANRIKASEHAVVQTYLRKPFLIDGYKFDLRVYVTVTSCDPLRIFVFKDGLARFATCKYVDPSSNNCDNVFMHVTNYAVQKNSDSYVDDEYTGTKRRISTINRWLRENGYNVEKLWQDIDDIAIKTIISAQPLLRHNYRTCFPNHVQGSACFEVLGFDIVLDRKLRPHVLEVNHSPSFTTDAQIDLDIKEALIYDTLDLINICGVDRKKCLEDDKRRVKERLLQRQTKKDLQEEMEREAEAWCIEQEKYEAAHLGNYRRIYPIPGSTEKYDKLFQNSGSLFAETAAFRARQECARQQREDLTRKQDQLTALLKKNKDRTMRPESPERGTQQVKRRIIRRPPLPQKRLAQMTSDDFMMPENSMPSGAQGGATIDIMKPMGIIDDEEVERLSGLIQRENLIRSLGVVEQVYRLLHGTPGTVSSVKSQPVGVIQYGQNRLPQAQYPPFALDSSNMTNGTNGSNAAYRKGQSNSTSDSGFDGGSRSIVGSRSLNAQQQQQPQQQPQKRVLGQAVAQLHIVSGPSEALNRPVSTYFTNDATGASHWRSAHSMPNVEAHKMNQKRAVTYSAAASVRKPSTQLSANGDQALAAAVSASDRTDIPLGAHMRKLLSMQGSIESVLPQSMQNPLKQGSVPLQSSDLIHYQHQSAAAGVSPFLQSIRKRSGPDFVNTDPRQEFEWLDEASAKENEARHKNGAQKAPAQNTQSSTRNVMASVDWPLAETMSGPVYGLQLKGLSLKAPVHP